MPDTGFSTDQSVVRKENSSFANLYFFRRSGTPRPPRVEAEKHKPGFDKHLRTEALLIPWSQWLCLQCPRVYGPLIEEARRWKPNLPTSKQTRKTHRAELPRWKHAKRAFEGERCPLCDGPLEDLRVGDGVPTNSVAAYPKVEVLPLSPDRPDNAQRWHKYGLTFDEWRKMMIAQKGRCAICRDLPQTKDLCIDHDHQTGEVRGLLCNSCNLGNGLFRDNPAFLRAAALYLERR